MNDQGQHSDAEAESRSDEGFADAAGNGNGLAGLNVEDAEGADHAADRPQESQERRQGDDDAQIIEMTAKARDKDPRLHFDKGLPFGASLAFKNVGQNEGQTAGRIGRKLTGLIDLMKFHVRIKSIGKSLAGIHLGKEDSPFDADIHRKEGAGQ